jgi:hypothetical protein
MVAAASYAESSARIRDSTCKQAETGGAVTASKTAVGAARWRIQKQLGTVSPQSMQTQPEAACRSSPPPVAAQPLYRCTTHVLPPMYCHLCIATHVLPPIAQLRPAQEEERASRGQT